MLFGMLDDGATGLLGVAACDGMPRAAVGPARPDHFLLAAGIGSRLAELIRHLPAREREATT